MLRPGARLTSLAAAALAALAAAGIGAPAADARTCPRGQFDRGGTCTTYAEAARQVAAIARSTMAERDAPAVILRVDIGRRMVVNRGLGESVDGVPASPDMHFRPGSMVIPMLTETVLALRDDGKLSLNDKLAKWFPQYPNADRVTLRMLAASMSGYPDYIQGNEPFQQILFSNPFRRWTDDDLLRYAFALAPICDPGACFHYAHTNFVLLGRVLEKITGRSLTAQLTSRYLRPLGLRDTRITKRPTIPEPALHAYSRDRGVFEDSTFWSPSWGLSDGLIMTSNARDMTRVFRAIGSGRSLSRAARRQLVVPASRGLPGAPRTVDYALGIFATKGWIFQNPQFNGHQGVVAFMRERGISVFVENNYGPNADPNRSISATIFGRISEYLTPDRALQFR